MRHIDYTAQQKKTAFKKTHVSESVLHADSKSVIRFFCSALVFEILSKTKINVFTDVSTEFFFSLAWVQMGYVSVFFLC